MDKTKERLILEAILRANATYYRPGYNSAKSAYNPNDPNGYHAYWVPTAVGDYYQQWFIGSTAVAMGPSGYGKDYLIGGSGNDVLWGGNGTSMLSGRDGNDTLIGGVGNTKDSLDGV